MAPVDGGLLTRGVCGAEEAEQHRPLQFAFDSSRVSSTEQRGDRCHEVFPASAGRRLIVREILSLIYWHESSQMSPPLRRAPMACAAVGKAGGSVPPNMRNGARLVSLMLT